MTDQYDDEPYNELEDEDEHLEWVYLSDLHDDPDNLRDDYTDIEDLAASIKETGLLQPIVVRRDERGLYVIVAGHRRKRALRQLGKLSARVLVRHKAMLEDEVIAAMLAENNNRVNLDPIEEARGLARLKAARGITSEHELGVVVGRSGHWVSGRLRLLALTPEQQRDVRSRVVGIAAAQDMAREQSGKKRPNQRTANATHLGNRHSLASRVTARCKSKKHPTKGANRVGGVGCGECWEAVIRADEREALARDAAAHGECSTCGAGSQAAAS